MDPRRIGRMYQCPRRRWTSAVGDRALDRICYPVVVSPPSSDLPPRSAAAATGAPAARVAGEARPASGDAAEVRPSASSPIDEQAVACLLEAAQDLGAAVELRPALGRVAECLKRYLAYDTLGILLLDPLGRELRFELAVGYPPEVAEHWRFGMGQGIVGSAARRREPIAVGDVLEDPRYIRAGDANRSELAVPLLAKGRSIGVLLVGSRAPHFFTSAHVRILSLLARQLANAIENAQLNTNMRQQARTLSLLHEVSHQLASILDREELLERVAELVKRLVRYDLFSVLLWNPDTQLLEPWLKIRSDGRPAEDRAAGRLGYGISGASAALRQPLRVPNVHIDPRYVRGAGDPDVRSELAVPLLFKGRLIGVLDLESVEYDAFSEGNEQLLATLASSIALALDNARLVERLMGEEKRAEADLAAAREIQRELLPATAPQVPGLEAAVAFGPATRLGGDFYQFLEPAQGRLGLALGDVAGRSMMAALYGLLAFGVLREAQRKHPEDTQAMLLEMNGRLLRLRTPNRYLALLYAICDARSGELTVANAGLPRPYLVRRGMVERIAAEGVPLGLLPEPAHRPIRLPLQPGDTAVFCSDGVESTLDPHEREFGPDSVVESLRRRAGGGAADMAAGLLGDSGRHAGPREPADDRTILALRYIG